jgi:pimeloyl-ACP methyl ester carboxylesterase
MKKIFILTLLVLLSSNIYANTISQDKCEQNDEEFIFAGGECINYFVEEGDKEDELTIILHGAWPDGTNTLARYSPFASNVSMATDITTVAIALPGYSKSSTNNLKSLTFKDNNPRKAQTKEYVLFLGETIKALKLKFNAKTINVVAHSASAMMSSTLTALEPNLIQNIALAGGKYTIKDKNNNQNLISINDYLDTLSTNTKYLIIYGTKDKIAPAKHSKDLHNKLIKKGINSKIIAVKDFAHLDLDMTDESIEAITTMLE